MFFKQDGDITILTSILLTIGTILGIFALIALGIVGFKELGLFLFFDGTIINLIKGLVFISIAMGVPIGIKTYFEYS